MQIKLWEIEIENTLKMKIYFKKFLIGIENIHMFNESVLRKQKLKGGIHLLEIK